MHHAMVYLVSVSAVERTKQMRKIENDLLRPRAGGEGGLAMLFIWGSRNAEKNDGTKEIAISDSENTGKKSKTIALHASPGRSRPKKRNWMNANSPSRVRKTALCSHIVEL